MRMLKLRQIPRCSSRILPRALFGTTASPVDPTTWKKFVLLYDYVPNMIELRGPHRAGHLEWANGFVRKNQLIVAGPTEPSVDGGVFIFQGKDKSLVEEYVKNDPYMKAGLISSYKIKEWTVTIGKF
jgi:uncharacterized protein YciI